MKHSILIALLIGLMPICFGQQDQAKFAFGVSTGYVKDSYFDLGPGGYSISNMQWYGTSYGLVPQKDTILYKGLHFGFHLGAQIPLYKNGNFSVGVYPKVNIGRMIQLSPEGLDFDTYEEFINDSRSLKMLTFGSQGLGYVRYSFASPTRSDMEFKLLGGYRYFRFGDNYFAPVLGLEMGFDHFTIGCYSNLVKQQFYREFSNGETELARTLNEFFFNLNFFLFRKK